MLEQDLALVNLLSHPEMPELLEAVASAELALHRLKQFQLLLPILVAWMHSMLDFGPRSYPK